MSLAIRDLARVARHARTPLLALLALALAAGANAAMVAPSDCLPPPGAYEGSFHAQYAAGLIDLNDPIHRLFTICDHPELFPHNEQFGSTVQANVSVNGGPAQSMQAPATCTVHMSFGGLNGSTQIYNTEMLQLDIAGGSLPPGVMIRESPTLQSLGKTTIEPLSGGDFRITSFFDIFTELSLDGGQTWFPSTDSNGQPYAGHMELNPDPVAIQQSSWGQIKSLYHNP